MRRLTLLLTALFFATACMDQDQAIADGSALCAESASDLAPAQDSALHALASAQWNSQLQWASGEEPVGLSLQLSVASEDGALIERALLSEEGWAAPEDCASTIEAWGHVHLWTNDGQLDARFSGDVVVQEDGRARFSGGEDNGVRYLAVTFDGPEMSGMLLPPEDEFADDADADGVSVPAASWPAE